MSACRSCGAEIDWALTEGGKRIPLDRGEVEGGNIVVRAGIAVVSPTPLLTGRVSHFATCPFAAAHRKKSAKSRN